MTNGQDKLSSVSSAAIVIKNETYIKTITEISKVLSESYNKVCYVTLNRMYNPLLRSLIGNNVNVDKFYFVDGITRTAITAPENLPNCDFISAPNRLTEISIAIEKAITKQKVMFYYLTHFLLS